MLGFRAESDLPSEELIQAFSALDWHLPEYGPTWIPEGFELIDEYRDPANSAFIYYNAESGDVITFEYSDYGETDSLTGILTDADHLEAVFINGHKAVLGYTDPNSPDFDPSEINNGTDLTWADDDIMLIFSISGSPNRETILRFAESIKAIE